MQPASYGLHLPPETPENSQNFKRPPQPHVIGFDRKNKYSGSPQDTPMQNVAGMAINAVQLRRDATSATIQTVKAIAAIVRSQTKPDVAAFTCHASTIAMISQPFF